MIHYVIAGLLVFPAKATSEKWRVINVWVAPRLDPEFQGLGRCSIEIIVWGPRLDAAGNNAVHWVPEMHWSRFERVQLALMESLRAVGGVLQFQYQKGLEPFWNSVALLLKSEESGCAVEQWWTVSYVKKSIQLWVTEWHRSQGLTPSWVPIAQAVDRLGKTVANGSRGSMAGD